MNIIAWFFSRYEPVLYFTSVVLILTALFRLAVPILISQAYSLVGLLKTIWAHYIDYKIQRALLAAELAPYFRLYEKLLNESPDNNPKQLTKTIDLMTRQLENKKTEIMTREQIASIGGGMTFSQAGEFRRERSKKKK